MTKSLLFGRKSTDLITPTKRIVEEDERSEQSHQKPPRYTTPNKPVMEYRSPPIDDDTDVEDEPKLKVKEHVSIINLSIDFLIYNPDEFAKFVFTNILNMKYFFLLNA